MYFYGMIIYNETIIVDETIYEEWLSWMKIVYIPAVMDTGFFDAHRILKVVDSPNEGVTYCIQYQTKTKENYNQFNSKHQIALQSAHQQKFENKFVMFNTLMETVD